jgi:hypothetical protein
MEVSGLSYGVSVPIWKGLKPSLIASPVGYSGVAKTRPNATPRLMD